MSRPARQDKAVEEARRTHDRQISLAADAGGNKTVLLRHRRTVAAAVAVAAASTIAIVLWRQGRSVITPPLALITEVTDLIQTPSQPVAAGPATPVAPPAQGAEPFWQQQPEVPHRPRNAVTLKDGDATPCHEDARQGTNHSTSSATFSVSSSQSSGLLASKSTECPLSRLPVPVCQKL